MPTISKLNYINVGPEGTFKPSGIAAYDSTPKDVDAIFTKLDAENQNHILLYFHGGLVSEQEGMNTAETVSPLLETAGVYPVSFIWETGFLETIQQNLGSIWETTFFKKILEKVIKVAGGKLGIALPSSVGTRGVNTLTDGEIQEELKTPAPFKNYIVQTGSRSVNLISGNDHLLSDEIEVEVEQQLLADPFFRNNPFGQMDEKSLSLIKKEKLVNTPVAGSRGILSIAGLIKAAVTIIFKIVKRFVGKRDHQFYPTIIEEILREVYVADFGVWLWSDMKNKAQEIWKAITM